MGQTGRAGGRGRLGSDTLILLDTHAWIWHIGARGSLSAAARELIDRQINHESIAVSAISVWEFMTLVKKGRLELKVPPEAYLTATHRDVRMFFTPVDETIARRSVQLPDLHADPADRIILATAQEMGMPVISRNGLMPEYGVAEVIW